MHIHILGICGTFMAGIATLAKQLGHRVTGVDQCVYPPMSTYLQQQGIDLQEGYSDDLLPPEADLIIIGNALSRGVPVVEAVLRQGLPYCSGAQWLSDNILREKWVLAVSGTHGKTTTASLLTWILEANGYNPSFLIGGMPTNFNVSARLTDSSFFVIEADEYDTAFFDKRSKFVHYHARTLIINNLEFDHADIFPDLAAIARQFHHLVRTVPDTGLIICPDQNEAIDAMLAQGCWTPVERLGQTWQMQPLTDSWQQFEVQYQGQGIGNIHWSLLGQHNAENALAAIVAARHVGVQPELAIEACNQFAGVKRRLEKRGEIAGITVYDDFAHHPTAIEKTIASLRAQIGSARLIAIAQLGSYTMRCGCHGETIGKAFNQADQIYCLQPPELKQPLAALLTACSKPHQVFTQVEDICTAVLAEAKPGDHLLIMSNKGFDNIHEKLLNSLSEQQAILTTR